ncbi:MAG: esterase-like activity of phytase family protein [Cyanobacteria bacterium J06592_8]
MSTELRASAFNVFLNRPNEGELIEDLSTPDDPQAQAVAEIIQRVNPDVILLNEFDYDAEGEGIQLFQDNYLSVSQNGVDPIEYPYVYLAPSNTGIPSGFDFNNDGEVVTETGVRGYGDDSFGFGFFPGQFAMVLLSKYPIVEEEVRTFQEFLWKDMPDALLPDNPETPEPQDWYSPEELDVFRLSSKSHWDVPVNVDGEVIHVLASHPTPPVFDGEEDRNGTRNFDEIRFWADYVTPGEGEYIYDDEGNLGGLMPGERFIIMGDQNADPYDGDSIQGAIQQLLENPFVNVETTPKSVEGGADAAIRQGGVNLNHLGNPALDTGDFNDQSAGNLWVDYVLPSQNLDITESGVFWPESDDPLFYLVGEGFPVVSSDHRLVYADVAIPEVPSNTRQTVTNVEFLGEVVFETGFEFYNTEVGGISGMTYNPFQNIYYALSDDRSSINDARFYTVEIDLTDGHLNDGDVSFTEVTTLLNAEGESFSEGGLDPEGIALTSFGTVFISSEGDVSPNRGEAGIIDPFVNEFSLTGQQIRELPVPEKFLSEIEDTNNNGIIDEGDTAISGIQRNRAFENLTITPDQRTLYTATEGALIQDLISEDGVNPYRIIQYDLTTGEPVEELLYFPDEFESTFGLVELVALDNSGTLLSLERTFSPEAGNTLRLFEVNTEFATNVAPETGLTDLENLNTITSVEKRLLLDFSELGIRLDNSEAVTFGPTLEDGRQSLIVVSDNNFNAGNQITQFLAFGLEIEPAPQPELVGFASLPADTFADGPESGEGVSSDERTGPFPGQPVGGWSGVQFADEDSYWFLVDSLFGGDSDTLARIYKVDPDFAGLENGDGSVELESEFITLSDPNNFIPFEIRNADDPERPLTGTDFDTEALVIGANGDLWVGDEYGPYLLHFDPNGVLLKAPIPTPEITVDGPVEGEFVRAPQNPEVESGEAEANLRGSRGFEGIAYSPDRSILYPILEAPVDGDPENSLRIYQYDVAAGEYASELVGLYPLDNPGDTPTFQLGDFTPINDHEFLVIERDDFEAEEAFFKKVFKVDISEVDDNGFVKKEEVIDLLNIADPNDLNGDNNLAFDLPITSVEDVLVYDEKTVLVSVDNNYPFGDFAMGRPPELDNNEIILVELPEPLDLDPLLGVNGLIPEVNTLPNGVASGDTTQDSTVLWARSLAEGEITFEYSTDADFSNIVGTVTATVEETNIPVKVEITELEAGTDYYYRVTDAAGTTAEGIFETAAEMGTQAGLSFGVTGDWRGELAPYPAITNVAEQELDFFVEHGDTIYADIGSPAVLNPDGTRKEQAETLDEYRAKHNEVYSERLGLNAWADVRSSTSILATIDDHEVINDFAGGAPASSDERFPETEGLINDTELFENGLQTFQEYNPLRDDFYGETGEERTEGERKLYRYNTYGSDAAVMVLDTRSFRDEALAGPEDFTNPEDVAEVLTATLTEDITMLGEVQLEDLKQDLVAADEAGITWKFIMVPEPMQNIFPGVNTDAFEGYGKERTEILKFITENEIDNVVFVAADVHTTFVNNITYQEEPFGEQIPTNIFGITTGAVAFDAPTGEFLGDLFVSGNPDAEALYNSLPIAPDTDDIPDDKDDFVEQAINSTLLEPFGFDPLGLDNNLPQAEGLIDAELLQGDYFVGHTYGWTQFDIDSETQELTVTTYGIEAYTEEELLANPEEIISQEPEIVSQFVVNPQADTPTPPEPRKTISNIEFIGEGNLETGLIFEGTEVGGLSGIAYDEANNTYYAISDDRSNINPARFYNLSIDLSDGTLDTDDITVQGVTTLLDTEGEPFNEESLDPEGIALTEAGTVIISSEGNVGELVNPFVNEFSLDGQQLQEFPIPEKFLPTADQSQGIRDNEAFESLTLTPDGNTLYTAAESALFQDGPSAGINQESLARIIKYDAATGEPQQEFVYQVDAIEPPETPDDISRTNSLAELLAVDNAGTFLALERFFDSTGVNDNKLYEVSLTDATDVSEFDSIAGEDFTAITEKKLLVDFSEIGMNLDDFEGLVFGPELPDGRQSLIVVSDNDFDPATPATQFFAFAVELEAVSDTPTGTDGDDILTGTNTSETIAGGLGNDNIEGNAGDDVLRGDADSRSTGGTVGGNDTINGGSGDDNIGGKAGDDELFGGEGDDQIWGDDGDDILRGGLGNDTLTGDDFSGGQGSDIFVLAIGEGTDTITDFEVGVDVIGLAESLTVADLSISGNTISVGDEILATVLEVTELSESDFFTL